MTELNSSCYVEILLWGNIFLLTHYGLDDNERKSYI